MMYTWINPNNRICIQCGEEKPKEKFRVIRSGYTLGVCKQCETDRKRNNAYYIRYRLQVEKFKNEQ